ncbi:MAG: glycerol kinase GlpK [Gammaproteobacteria bacterium]|nr:glycerol kinase GlpK [Gammaproteobacteria bacterium]
MDVLIALDQGTTSSRCLGFDAGGNVVALAQREYAQHFPRDGWVEHEPEDIWQSTLQSFDAVVRELLGAGHAVVGIGISNQRETTLLWDRRTGAAVYRAIVWQDRRTADACARLQQHEGLGERVAARTGLLLDPYFSATKLAWILDNVAGARERAEAGELAFGTVDTFLLWRLTGGRRHCTDATNASRTMLFDIHAQCWDEELLARFGVPRAVLPEVLDSAADFGTVQAGLPAAGAPISGIAGDQQAALIGQGCLAPGQAKSTYGTGCFLVLNTGATPVRSHNRLLTTLAYRLDGRPAYALEGSIFVAGAAIKWLRDSIGLIASAAESEQVALRAPDPGGVYLVPAFTGLGAPHWDPAARGAILGLTRDSGAEAIVTAALQSVAYQTRDLLDAMARDGTTLDVLRVDGGMAANSWMLQFMADMLGIPVSRPRITEATALGAASLAGYRLSMLPTLDHLTAQCGEERRFLPAMPEPERARLYAGWLDAVARVRTT